MSIDEFSKLTGFYPTVSMYETIEKAYMESKMDKKEFCEAYKNNLDGMAEAISYWALVAQIAKENELIREKKELTERIKQLEKEVSVLEKKIEHEEEWADYEDGSNVKQADYEELAKHSRVISDEEAVKLIADDFGFAMDRIEIRHSVDALQINRHRMVRTAGKIEYPQKWVIREYGVSFAGGETKSVPLLHYIKRVAYIDFGFLPGSA